MKELEPLLKTHSKYFLRNFHIAYRVVIKRVQKFYFEYLKSRGENELSFNQYKFLHMNGK
jgi:hypothetical protein